MFTFMQRRFARLVALTALVFGSVMLTPMAAQADYPPTQVCNEASWGNVVQVANEWWICTYDAYTNDYWWEPAESLFDAQFGTANFAKTVGTTRYRSTVRGRVEDMTNGLRTGADILSGRNGVGWSAPAGWLEVRSFVYKWNGSAWVQCKDSGWKVNTATARRLTPTWNWGSACGYLGYYGTSSGGFQWTGSAWSGGYAWSGYVYFDNPLLRTSGQPAPPPPTALPPAAPQPAGSPAA